MTKRLPNRVHVLAHAGSARPDIARLGFRNGREMLEFIRDHLPAPWRLTGSARFLEEPDDEHHGGRHDDAARVRDLQNALSDPRTAAIVALKGGAYFSRILPQLDFSVLSRREHVVWAFGFSEMTTLVNIVATYPRGRGVYWLGPNYLGWKIKPPGAARAAYAEFWRVLAGLLGGDLKPSGSSAGGGQRRRPKLRGLCNEVMLAVESKGFRKPFAGINGTLVGGRLGGPSKVRLIGGCISVLIPLLTGPLGRRLRPEGAWLAIEDVNEAPYRVDRHLAALKMAGWFDKLAGVLVGDFHTDTRNETQAVTEMLRHHLPRERRIPIVITPSFGHVWPMAPLVLNRPLRMLRRGSGVRIESWPSTGSGP